MPSSLPRWPAGSDRSWDGLFQPFPFSPATAAFPIRVQGRRPHWSFRGLLNVHSRYGLSARCIAKATHLSRRLRRFRYLHRRSDSYRLERPSCRVGIAPTEDQHLSTAHTRSDLRQEAREMRIISKCETFHRNPTGNQPRPAEPGQQPEASLAWGRTTVTAKRRQRDHTLCD